MKTMPWLPLFPANTIGFHYGKHHKAFVDNLNKLSEGTDFEKMSLVDVIKKTAGVADKAGIFNNAAQIWNHTFSGKACLPVAAASRRANWPS